MEPGHRPIGQIVDNWQVPPNPSAETLDGRYARLEALSADDHAAPMFHAFEGHDWVWDYMSAGPFQSEHQFQEWMRKEIAAGDFVFRAIFDKERGAFGGFASYLRIKPTSGSIEVGYIAMSPQLQRTRAATEAMFLMMGWAFDAGYRRYEWKCDALNAASRGAAQRLGFSYEGIFRQATLVKGRNRDTAWFAAIDSEWPALRSAFQIWLSPDNFDASGKQHKRLSVLTRPVLKTLDPDQ